MRIAAVFFLLIPCFQLAAQTSDTSDFPLQKISPSKVGEFRMPSSEHLVGRNTIDKFNPYSMVAVMNSIPGVRMEERSPGSYRLSIRGSLLRSPFGVRNIKIYIGEFPFTDAGGNTYLNSLDLSNIHSVRVLKGPESSIFGANTGGVVIIDPVPKSSDSSRASVGLSTGSFGLRQMDIWYTKRFKTSVLTINQAYQKSNGYRENSAMKRQYMQVSELWNYRPDKSLHVLVLFSDLYYQTPGGLTQVQWNENRRQARPASNSFPGAIVQKAAVYNNTVFAGITHNFFLKKQVKHTFSVFGSSTDFKNPFITNYEQRKEQNIGMRTYFELKQNNKVYTLRFNLGAEAQQTNSLIKNYGNRLGVRDTLQASDRLIAQQGFLFSRLLLDIHRRLLIETSLSYNVFNYRFMNKHAVDFTRIRFNPQLMPRLAVSYTINSLFSWRASAGSGYSSPTLSEVRASNNIINTSLQAEKARNLETGIRFRHKSGRYAFDFCAFYYQLHQAIVRRTDSGGNEFFLNTGGTKQPGFEGQAEWQILRPRKTGWLRSLDLKANFNYYQFRFKNYSVNGFDFSRNPLTGVPDYSGSVNLTASLPYHLSFFIQYYDVNKIPLNDANTVHSKAYHLLQIKMQWKKQFSRISIVVFAGIDNLFNENYSLGNDLNAAGGRYFNAAAPRNYYGGFKVGL